MYEVKQSWIHFRSIFLDMLGLDNASSAFAAINRSIFNLNESFMHQMWSYERKRPTVFLGHHRQHDQSEKYCQYKFRFCLLPFQQFWSTFMIVCVNKSKITKKLLPRWIKESRCFPIYLHPNDRATGAFKVVVQPLTNHKFPISLLWSFSKTFSISISSELTFSVESTCLFESCVRAAYWCL